MTEGEAFLVVEQAFEGLDSDARNRLFEWVLRRWGKLVPVAAVAEPFTFGPGQPIQQAAAEGLLICGFPAKPFPYEEDALAKGYKDGIFAACDMPEISPEEEEAAHATPWGSGGEFDPEEQAQAAVSISESTANVPEDVLRVESKQDSYGKSIDQTMEDMDFVSSFFSRLSSLDPGVRRPAQARADDKAFRDDLIEKGADRVVLFELYMLGGRYRLLDVLNKRDGHDHPVYRMLPFEKRADLIIDRYGKEIAGMIANIDPAFFATKAAEFEVPCANDVPEVVEALRTRLEELFFSAKVALRKAEEAAATP